ncbi:head maturation protease, ClpP-related [Vaginisenegalia massiliensis]|uniref:head maturation protease, ClpP-related n=1 Tax=Vaginisenegalia massiliensis TaxID=2058294 RepID=UPI000F51F319|nr:head maturation protease, ClpP-related [Vaginisenegalia massiliensis]
MNKLKKVPFKFKNEVVNGATVLTLSGPVGQPYPWEDEDSTINAKLVKSALDGYEGDVLIKLNSPGGDVFEGIEIYNYLKSLSNHVTVEVTALAASAASIISMSADKLVMDVGSNMMIHKASTVAWGNEEEIMKTVKALQSIDSSLVAIYAEKTGKSDDEIRELIANETWMTANETVEAGFADEVGNVKTNETTEESEPQANIVEMLQVINQKVETIEDKLAQQVVPIDSKELVDVIKNSESKPKQNVLKNLLGGI